MTICTKDRKYYFGEVIDGRMELNKIGTIVQNEFIKTEQIRQNIQLDESVVIPNHVHVIFIINPNHTVETTRWVVSKPEKEMTHRVISTLTKNSLGSMIGQFKPAASKQIQKINPSFKWQPNYYDHIIRDDDDLKRIQQYINENPQNWEQDRNNPEGLFM